MKPTTIILTLSLCLVALAACEKEETLLNQVNSNAPSQTSFWRNQQDALGGLNAAYSNVQAREITLWELFQYDNRSDESYSQSPWNDLANVGRFIFIDYNLPFVFELWRELYRGIYRCNQVIDNVPKIEMDAALKARLVAEAKFLRGHLYYKLVTLWGRVPLVTTVGLPTDRPAQATEAEGWAQIEKDFTEAKAVLPDNYTGGDVGRITKGGATAYLGRALLQQKKWAQASAQFSEILAQVPMRYDLMPNFADNFTEAFENNKESLFEIQFLNNNGKDSGFPSYDITGGDETSERAQFFGVRGIGWCDAQPTKWLQNEFLKEKDKDGKVDQRLDYTIYYFQPGPVLYNKTYADRGFGENDRFWKKYTNYWKGTDSYFSGINTRVIRLADVYLMQAECLNETGQTAAAIPLANRVRQRANMPNLSLGLSTQAFREQLRHDRVMELAGESVRFLDLRRYGLLSPALAGPTPDLRPDVSNLDTEFKNVVVGKSEYLPIPLYEIDANPNLKQNNGW